MGWQRTGPLVLEKVELGFVVSGNWFFFFGETHFLSFFKLKLKTMKKVALSLFVAAFAMTSCSTVYKTASTRNVQAPLVAAVTGDLEVSNHKVTYTYVPPREVRKGGVQNCINSAIREVLQQSGDADVLVETQKAIVHKQGLLRLKVKSVTVTGYPAKYRDFKSVDDKTLKNCLIEGSFSDRPIIIRK